MRSAARAKQHASNETSPWNRDVGGRAVLGLRGGNGVTGLRRALFDFDLQEIVHGFATA